MTPHSIYLHIPFCSVKCSYCAFNTYINLDHLIPWYVDALVREIELVGAASPSELQSHTLYFGGGTPSMLGVEQIQHLIGSCRDHLHLKPESEITLEVEPNTVDGERLRGYRDAGVNRVSLGVQSVHQADLAMFKRGHTFAESQQTFEALRAADFDNISIDLIYGAPRQTLAGWRETLERVLQWQPEHFSLYSLIQEPKTELTFLIEKGRIPAPNDDLAADMYELARRMLADAGYRHYELSTWAKSEQYESLHNHQYWDVQPYFGLGAGAHGAMYGSRYWNVRTVQGYIDAVHGCDGVTNGRSASMAGCETNDVQTQMLEVMMLGLRRIHRGVAYQDFKVRFGVDLREHYQEVLEQLDGKNLIELRSDRIVLVLQGYLVANQVFQYFV